MILPGATIGFLGGGQLGRMAALAARAMGYRVAALDPDPDCPIRPIAERCVTAPFDDAAAAGELARHCDVITLEIEKVALEVLAAAAAHAPVRPGAHVLAEVQERDRQKAWLARYGFPLGAYREARSAAEVAAAARALAPGRCFVKSRFGGYDGRGQFELERPEQAAEAFAALGGGPCVVERALDLAGELSVLVARRPSGEIVAYPPAWNHHVDRILAWSVLPAELPPATAAAAQELAAEIARALDVVGLLCIELFLLADGTLLVNELAPRPHNSYHASERASATSQFEQLVRAVCDLPLGSTEVLRPAAIVNLLGDLWFRTAAADGLHPEAAGGAGATPLAAPDRGAPSSLAAPDFAAALALPGTRLHLYGKREARPGRKMGHLSAIGATPAEAAARAQQAMAALAGRATPTLFS